MLGNILPHRKCSFLVNSMAYGICFAFGRLICLMEANCRNGSCAMYRISFARAMFYSESSGRLTTSSTPLCIIRAPTQPHAKRRLLIEKVRRRGAMRLRDDVAPVELMDG